MIPKVWAILFISKVWWLILYIMSFSKRPHVHVGQKWSHRQIFVVSSPHELPITPALETTGTEHTHHCSATTDRLLAAVSSGVLLKNHKASHKAIVSLTKRGKNRTWKVLSPSPWPKEFQSRDKDRNPQSAFSLSNLQHLYVLFKIPQTKTNKSLFLEVTAWVDKNGRCKRFIATWPGCTWFCPWRLQPQRF